MRPSMLTETDRLMCAGATATYLLQAIRIVDRFMGPHIASQCAKSMLIDVSHTGHIPYLPLLTETKHAMEIGSLHQLHREVGLDVDDTGAVAGHDVAVLQVSMQLGLLREHLLGDLVVT